MKINLPAKFSFDDHHGFDEAKYILQKVIPAIKVKEIGFNGNYVGIAYVGQLTDKKVKNLVDKIKKTCEDFV